MTPYNYAKSFYDDLAHHHWVGALKMGFDAAVETTIQVEAGMLGTMVLQEFITMSPSSIFSGKSPVKTDRTGHRSPYQWGYGLGNETGGLAVTIALAIVTFVIGGIASGIGDFVDGLSGESASGNVAADANVSGDANNVSRLQNAENANGHLDQIDVRAHDVLSEGGAESAVRPGGEGAEANAPSRAQRVLNGLRKFASWSCRKGILPHDPQDPFPWEENLTTGQRARHSSPSPAKRSTRRENLSANLPPGVARRHHKAQAAMGARHGAPAPHPLKGIRGWIPSTRTPPQDRRALRTSPPFRRLPICRVARTGF